VAQSLLAADGNDRHFPRIRTVGVRADLDHDLFIGLRFEEAVDIVARGQVAPADGQKVLAFLDVYTGLRERRAKIRVPVLAVINPGETVTPVLDLVIAAEQSAGHKGRRRLVTTSDEHVSDGELVEHLGEKVGQIASVRYRVYVWGVAFLHLFQIQSVK